MGNKTIPEEIILREATWKALRLIKPSFINIKLLPHITEREIKMNQLKKLLFKIRFFAKVREYHFHC